MVSLAIYASRCRRDGCLSRKSASRPSGDHCGLVATQRVNKVKRTRNLFRVRFFCALLHSAYMANEQNLKPARTKSEARERGRAGGKASGEARRRKADFRRTLNALLTTEIDSTEWTPILNAMGLDSTLESAVNMAMINVNSAKKLH
mgnify:CR=1 FL=1